MSEDGPSKRVRTAASRRHLIAWLATGGVVAAGLIYIIVTMVIKPNGHFAKGPAGEAVSTGPATVSEAAPGSMHVIPAMSARGVGQLVPEIAFTGPDGKPVTIASLKGKVVLLNFWTANCAECRSSFPVLEKLIARRSPDELVVIAVNLDHSRARADAALKQFGGHVSVFYDPAGAVAERYHLSQASGALLIDRSGRVRDIRQGGLASAANAFDARITELLAAE